MALQFRSVGLLFLALGLLGCSGPRPILYPNAHLETVGQEAAERDVDECRELAKAAGARPASGKSGQVAGSTAVGAGVGAAAGAAGGAVVGAAARGSAVGAVGGAVGGLFGGLFRRPAPNQAYKNFVDRCLIDRGYEPVGWE